MIERNELLAEDVSGQNIDVPEVIKFRLSAKAEAVINDVLKPRYLDAQTKADVFNYLVNIYPQWDRHYFYLCGKYHCPNPQDQANSLDKKLARLEYVGDEKFNIAYMRHTKQWAELHQALSIEESIDVLINEPYFLP